jgi:hypothetical protein
MRTPHTNLALEQWHRRTLPSRHHTKRQRERITQNFVPCGRSESLDYSICIDTPANNTFTNRIEQDRKTIAAVYGDGDAPHIAEIAGAGAKIKLYCTPPC